MPKIKEEAIESADVEIAKEVLFLLSGLIILIALFSVWVIYSASHNLQGSVYYTIASLIDVNSEGYAAAIMAGIAPFTIPFYELILVELVDGIAKVVLIGFIVAVVINALTNIDINSKINWLRSGRLNKHVVLCGFSGLGEQIVDQLSAKKRPFLVIDKSQTKLEELNERGHTALDGDFTNIETLRKAGVEKASAVIFCAETDITNLMGILAARKLNKEITVISRARDAFTVAKMQRAGADLCIIPELLAGLELGNKLVGI